MQIDRVGRNGKAVKFKVRSSELPLVGGPAMLIAISAACLGVGYALNLNDTQWILMAILLLAMLGYGIVGFVDDVRKVYRGTGISEIQKFIGVTLVSLLAAVAFNRLIIDPKLTARLAYSPYSRHAVHRAFSGRSPFHLDHLLPPAHRRRRQQRLARGGFHRRHGWPVPAGCC